MRKPRGLSYRKRLRLGIEAKAAMKSRAAEDEVCETWGIGRQLLKYYQRAPVPTNGNLRNRKSRRPGLDSFLLRLIDRGGRLSFGNALLVANAYAEVMKEPVVSDSWITRFMHRNSLRGLVPRGERAASDVPAAEKYVAALVDIRTHATATPSLTPYACDPPPPQPPPPPTPPAASASRTASSQTRMRRRCTTAAPRRRSSPARPPRTSPAASCPRTGTPCPPPRPASLHPLFM